MIECTCDKPRQVLKCVCRCVFMIVTVKWYAPFPVKIILPNIQTNADTHEVHIHTQHSLLESPWKIQYSNSAPSGDNDVTAEMKERRKEIHPKSPKIFLRHLFPFSQSTPAEESSGKRKTPLWAKTWNRAGNSPQFHQAKTKCFNFS